MRMASSTRVTPSAVVSPGQDRLGPRGLDEGLGGEVVDLGRPVLAQDPDE